MSIAYHVAAAVVNESTTHIDRRAARITRLCHGSEESFLRTYPLVLHPRNQRVLPLIREELPPFRKNACLGISFLSYGCINFISFQSSFKLFRLDTDDRVELFFDDGSVLDFAFGSPPKSSGLMVENVAPISDEQLYFCTARNLVCWRLSSARNQLSLYGGFTSHEHNRQYQSERTAQKIFRLMAVHILQVKETLC